MHKKFNEECGIVKINNPLNEKEKIYAVYGDFFDSDSDIFENELGQAIGSGKTEKEALQNAIIHLVKYIKNSDKDFYELKEKLEELDKKTMLNKREVILPIRGFDQINGSYREIEECWNASINIDKKGKPSAGIN